MIEVSWCAGECKKESSFMVGSDREEIERSKINSSLSLVSTQAVFTSLVIMDPDAVMPSSKKQFGLSMQTTFRNFLHGITQ